MHYEEGSEQIVEYVLILIKTYKKNDFLINSL